MSDFEVMLMAHLRQLCVTIGPRPNGSAGNHAAAAYIEQVFQEAGLEVERQQYDCPAWEEVETYLALNGTPLEAVANVFSPPCEVSAPGVAVCSLAEVVAADLTGRIAILYGDLTKNPLSPKSWFLLDEHDRRLIELLEAKQPAALITVQNRLGRLERVIEDWEFTLPSATVPAEVGLALLQQSDPHPRLRLNTRQKPGHTANIIGHKAGADSTRLVLCAHYDTKFDTPGAYDNGGGVAVLLTLAQRLGRQNLPVGLQFIAFTGEEYMPIGDETYLHRYEADFGQFIAAINVDGVGYALNATSITALTASPAFEERVMAISRNFPGVVWVDPWPQSNHSTFAWRGVPSLALSGVEAWHSHYPHHLRSDTLDWLSPAKLAETAALVQAIVESLQAETPAWSRGEIRD